MKILIIPDSFKGSLSSEEVGETIKKGILELRPDIKVEALPFADGGEGFAYAMQGLINGKEIRTVCHNIYGQEISGHIIANDDTAVIECATASGLLPRKNVMQASSYGTGELIRFAASQGYRKIILGLGGTGCCDGGAGCLAGLGAKFYDESQNIIQRPKGIDINHIFGISFKSMIKDIDFMYACDVENEYFGKNGAAYVYAPQKGARKTDVEELDEGFKRLNAFFKKDIGSVKGTGAAGGICGALYAVYGGEIKSGFEILADYAKLEERISDCDIVITGEGKTDEQTLMGKLPFRISELCKKHNKKCVIISGIIEDINIGDVRISLVDENISAEKAISQAKEILYQKTVNNLEIML